MKPLPALLLGAALALAGGSAAADQLPRSITVVSDDNYPPYIFRDATGDLRGIIPDQWDLWEKKTGVRVDLRAMDWAEAQRVMQEGGADVLDTVFRTPDRERTYDFTPPYADIRVPIYAHQSLGGISDIPSLKGFTVGVKAGDAVIDRLRSQGIDSFREYPSYKAIIDAAQSNEIKVFSIDEPAAVYHLYQRDIADQFRTAFILYTGAFHRAVHKGNPALLGLVRAGFDRFSSGETDAIREKWMGTPVSWPFLFRRFAKLLLAAAALFVLLAGGNLFLQAQVRRRTADLRESRTRFENILHLAPIGMGILGQRRLVEVNDSFCRMTGFSREELLNLPLEKLAPGIEEFQRAKSEFYAQLQDQGRCAVETVLRRRDGSRLPILVNGALFNPEDAFGEVIFTAMDLTERNRAEQDRLNYTQRLQEAQRIESLGILAGGIAHDFNNLLTAILGNIDLALLDIPKDSPARADLSTAVTATHRAADLAQQMLAYSGKGHFVIEVLDVEAEIRSTLQLLQSSISPRAELRVDIPSALPPVLADTSQFRQVLMNLIINASEALENQPGRIEIHAREIDGATLDSATLRPRAPLDPGPYVCIDIADSGAGIRPDFLDKIFDPFFSTKFTGRGLGLAAVLGILRGHHGALQVESAPGKGSSFRLFLPAGSEPVSRPASTAPTAHARTATGTIMLVDDEPGLRDTAAKLLQRLGYQCICAADGEQAIQLFGSRSHQIDAVILDLAMPRMDGAQTLELLRKIRTNIPVLISSGYAEDDVKSHFDAFPPDGYIQKPYTLDRLHAALDRLLAPPPQA